MRQLFQFALFVGQIETKHLIILHDPGCDRSSHRRNWRLTVNRPRAARKEPPRRVSIRLEIPRASEYDGS
jgi:hypothetical protein